MLLSAAMLPNFLGSPDRLLVGGLLGALFALAATFTLDRSRRKETRLNWVMLVLFMAARLLNSTTRASTNLEKAILGVEYFFLLSSIGRSAIQLVLGGLAERIFHRPPSRILSDLLQGGALLVVALVALQASGVNPASLLATSAVLTAVLGLSLQETLGNLFAGLAIQGEEPFHVGDFVQFDLDKAGVVTEINWRATKILTNDHYIITVPNGVLARASILNFSKPERFARYQVNVNVPYEAPAGVAELLVNAALSVEGVLPTPPPDAVLGELGPSMIVYRLRFFTAEHTRREYVSGRVLAAAHIALRRRGIRVPYPVTRLQSRLDGGKVDSLFPPSLTPETLDRVSLLSALGAEASAHIVAQSEPVRFAEGEVIVRQGDPGSDLYLVTAGRVRVELETPGRRTLLAELREGDFFGEMSVFTGESRAATVVAASEAEVLRIDGRLLRSVLEAEPAVLERISEELARRQTDLAARLASAGSVVPPEGASQLRERIREFFRL